MSAVSVSKVGKLAKFIITLSVAILSLAACATVIEAIDSALAPGNDAGADNERNGESDSRTRRTPIRPAETSPQSTSLAAAEQEIVRLVNARRREHGLEELLGHDGLSELSLAHSRDMGERGFHGHVSPDGVSPHDRITAGLGDRYYAIGISENVAYRFDSTRLTDDRLYALAEEFMEGWMNSPGHRANILRPESTHIGVGLYQHGDRVYGTQKFMLYTARLVDLHDGDSLPASDPSIEFEVNPRLEDAVDLVVRVDFPDSSARWETEGGRFYTGVGFPDAEWTDSGRFIIRLPIEEYGTGTYSVRLGTDGGNATSTDTFSFRVE